MSSNSGDGIAAANAANSNDTNNQSSSSGPSAVPPSNPGTTSGSSGTNSGTPTAPPPGTIRPAAQIRFNFGVSATVRVPTVRYGINRETAFIPMSAARSGGGPQVQQRQPMAPPPPVPPVPTNNNAGEIPPQQTQNLFQMRDRLFLALFFRVSLIYARAFPKTLRRVLEFCLLMQSILLLLILAYIHVVYTRTPITCLGDFKDSWPKNGVLRVEITSDSPPDYDLAKSYAKEERMRQRSQSQFGHYTDDILSYMLTADSYLLDRVVSTAGDLIATVTGSDLTSSSTKSVPEDSNNVVPTSKVETDPPDSGATVVPSTATEEVSPTVSVESSVSSSSSSSVESSETNKDGINNKSVEIEEDSLVAAAEGEGGDVEGTISPSSPIITASGDSANSNSNSVAASLGVPDSLENYDVHNPESIYFNKTLEEIETIKMVQKQMEEDKLLNSSITDFEMFANSVWLQEQAYIVEYALEYGFLRLSSETRQRLGIPVKLVTLDASKETCFGDRFSLFLLENFLGYDDILMSSIKNLAESEENKGYLRNVISGEQFRFVPMWMARSSYVPALMIMLVFTVSVSMLLRYSHHQIFVFIVDLLNNIEGAGSIHVPAAPLFTVILALVGMEAIMSEFFNDTSTAFYVILIVWIADQYDSICIHTNITKTYWVRFFYLYHFAFYAYHYRFNGQYGGLALLVSWSFIQHSMVYFYHHYELPAILRQAHQPHAMNNESFPANFNTGDGAPATAPQPTRSTSAPPTPSATPSTTTTESNNPASSGTTSANPPQPNASNDFSSGLLEPSRINPNLLGGGPQRSPGEEGSLLFASAPTSSSSSGRDNMGVDAPTPTIFNGRNTNSVNQGGGEGTSSSSNGMTSGVNNNDGNPTRVSGMGHSHSSRSGESEDVLLLSQRSPSLLRDAGDSPAQVAGTGQNSEEDGDDAGSSSSSKVGGTNPKANNILTEGSNSSSINNLMNSEETRAAMNIST